MNPHTQELRLYPISYLRTNALLEHLKTYNPFNPPLVSDKFQTTAINLINDPYMDLCYKDSETGMTPLMYAISNNLSIIALELLKYPNKSCPEMKDAEGTTALMHAVEFNDEIIVKALLSPDINCNINAQDLYGRTALMLAIVFNYSIIIINELLNHPLINPCIKDNDGETALMKAIDNSRLMTYRNNIKRVLKSIIQHSERCINFQNFEGKTALMYAITISDKEFVNVLLPYSDPSITDNDGNTALILAIEEHKIINELFSMNSMDIILKLLNFDSRPGHQNNEGKTALMIACDNDEWAENNTVMNRNMAGVVSMLLNTTQSCPECKDDMDYTALTYAHINENHDLVNIIMNYIVPILKRRIDRAFRNVINTNRRFNLNSLAKHIIDEWETEYGVQDSYNIRDIKINSRGVDYELFKEEV